MNSKCVLTFKFRAQAIFNAAKKDTLPALENLSLQNLFVHSTLQVPKTIYINQTFHDKDGFVKLRAVSKLTTFFLIHPVLHTI